MNSSFAGRLFRQLSTFEILHGAGLLLQVLVPPATTIATAGFSLQSLPDLFLHPRNGFVIVMNTFILPFYKQCI
jgi:hypothetical protein